MRFARLLAGGNVIRNNQWVSQQVDPATQYSATKYQSTCAVEIGMNGRNEIYPQANSDPATFTCYVSTHNSIHPLDGYGATYGWDQSVPKFPAMELFVPQDYAGIEYY